MIDQLRILFGIVLGAALIGWQFWPGLVALLAKARAYFATPAPVDRRPSDGPILGPLPINPVDEDVLDWLAIRRLHSRAKCDEQRAAMRQYIAHQLDDQAMHAAHATPRPFTSAMPRAAADHDYSPAR